MLANRVKETSNTTGTGTYSLNGAAQGFRTFVAGIGSSGFNRCYYVATMQGQWEIGIGTLTDGTPDTLARTAIIASSDGITAINWPAGEKEIFCTDLAQARNFKMEVDAARSGSSVLGANGWAKYPFSHVHAFPTGSTSDIGASQYTRVGLQRGLPDATPGALYLASDAAGTSEIVLFQEQAITFRAMVIATSSAYLKAWNITGAVRRMAGLNSLVGSPVITEVAADASMAGCAIAVSLASSTTLRFTATGIGAAATRWSAMVELLSAGYGPSL